MKQIFLTKGMFATVDDSDVDLVSRYDWYYSGAGYAARSVWVPGRKTPYIMYMHRLISSPETGKEIDHINLNRLDNRKSNLRICSSSQNKMNKGKQSNNSSGFKGVSRHAQSGKWQANITMQGKRKFLGLFERAEDASASYCEAAERLHGKFART